MSGEKDRDSVSLPDLYDMLLANQSILKELQEKSALVDKLQEKVVSLEKELMVAKESLNDREQYSRNWSVRIFGLSVTKEEEEKLGKDRAVMKKAYDKVLKPILQAAKDAGSIESVPSSYYNLLENGHALRPRHDPQGGKKPGSPSFIVRFSSRFMRNVVLRHKKDHMPRPTTAEVAAGVSKYSMYGDLTQVNFRRLRSMIEDERFAKCWSVDGKVRFILQNDPTQWVHHVNSTAWSLDDIYKSAMSAAKKAKK